MAVKVTVYGTANMKQIASARRELDALERTAIATGGGFQSAMTKVGSSMKTAGAAVSGVGRKMTTWVTLPIVGVGVASTKMAIDFDSSMSKIVGLVGIAKDKVDDMRQPIVDMASEFGVSADQAADAMFFITSAGLRGKNAMEVLRQSLMGAAAGLGDVKTIADLSTSAMNAYGPKVLSASKATDILTGAVRAGKLEPAELAEAMGAVLPLASSLGVSFDQVSAAMAGMSKTGTNAAEASTQLNAIFSALVKETPKGKQALKDVGLTYDELRKSVKDKGLLPTLNLLKKSFGGNAQATSAFFGNVRALRGVLDMLGANAKDTKAIFKQLENSTGMTSEAFGAAADTGGFKLQQAITSLKNSLIEIGVALAPVVTAIADFVKGAVAWFQQLTPEQKKLAAVFAIVAAAAGPVLMVLGSLITVVGTLATVIGAVSLPVVAVVAAIGLLVGAVIYAWNNFEWFRDAVGAVWGAIQAAISAVVDWFKTNVLPTIQAAIAWLQEQWRILEPVVRDVWNGIQAAVSQVVEWVKTYVWPLIQKYLQWIGTSFQALWTVVKYVWGVIQRAIEVFIQWFVNTFWPNFKKSLEAIGTVFEYVSGVAQRVWGIITSVIRTFVNWFVQNVWPKIKPIVDLITSAWDPIFTAVKAAWDKITTFLTNLVDTFLTIGTNIVNGIKQGFSNAWDAFTGWVKEQVDKLPDAVKYVLGIASPSRVFAEIGGNVVDGLRVGMTKKVPELVDAGKALAASLGNAMQDGGKSLQKTLDETYVAWFSDTVEKLKAKVAEAKQAFTDFATSTAAAITGSMSFADAQTGSADRAQAIVDAERALADARAAASSATATVADQAAVITAEQALADARAQGQQLGLTFIEALQAQAARAIEFSAKVKQAIAMGLSQASLQQVLSAGWEAGVGILTQLVQGGVGLITQTNDLVASTQAAADKVGVQAASTYYGTGVKTAQDTVNGFKDEFAKGGAGYKKLMNVMDSLAADAKRKTSIDVEVTRHITDVVASIQGARAGGGSVLAGRSYYVGERGTEVFTPSTNGTIIPNDRVGALSGGGRQIIVQPGAVTISITGAQDPARVADIAQAAVEQAFTDLARELAAS